MKKTLVVILCALALSAVASAKSELIKYHHVTIGNESDVTAEQRHLDAFAAAKQELGLSENENRVPQNTQTPAASYTTNLPTPTPTPIIEGSLLGWFRKA